MTHADADFLIVVGPALAGLDGGGVFFETHALIRERPGPCGPRRCAPAEAMAGGVAAWRGRPSPRMVFEWPAWWARA